jgi:hypothetical protein
LRAKARHNALVVPRSPSADGRRGISQCIQNTQSEIPLRRLTDRNDIPKEVLTQSPLARGPELLHSRRSPFPRRPLEQCPRTTSALCRLHIRMTWAAEERRQASYCWVGPLPDFPLAVLRNHAAPSVLSTREVHSRQSRDGRLPDYSADNQGSYALGVDLKS